MAKYASQVVAQALAWLGYNEADGSHKKIIDVYNSQKKLPRSYPVKYTDDWCATYVSAVAVKLGYTDIMPTECGCEEMIKLYHKIGCWDENDARVPNPGELIFYDWQDDGKGDNKGYTNHVGIVVKVVGNNITVIEGNRNYSSVDYRTIAVDGKYIRGYAVPKYDKETTAEPVKESTVSIELNVLRKGSKGEQVKALQRNLHSLGYDLGSNPVDGDFGSKTDAAVRAYQKKYGLTVDGIVGQQTWNKLLRG
jgi:hypothetical protein